MARSVSSRQADAASSSAARRMASPSARALRRPSSRRLCASSRIRRRSAAASSPACRSRRTLVRRPAARYSRPRVPPAESVPPVPPPWDLAPFPFHLCRNSISLLFYCICARKSSFIQKNSRQFAVGLVYPQFGGIFPDFLQAAYGIGLREYGILEALRFLAGFVEPAGSRACFPV